MAAVALVVHGVANRDADAFDASVAQLGELAGLSPGRLRPVFWGDLGPEAPLQSLPTEEDVAVLSSPVGAFDTGTEGAEDLDAAADVADRALDELRARAGPVPADTESLLRQATTEAAEAGYSLALAADVAPLLADVVIAADPAGTAQLASGAFGVDWIKDRAVDLLNRVNDMLVDLLVRQIRSAQTGVGGTLAHTLGDVFVYASRGPAIRGRLDDEYRRALAAGAGSVDIVAHSLGALVAVEWLLGASATATRGVPTVPADRRVRKLVTFGTQVSLFCELQGLRRTGDDFGAGPGRQSLAMHVDHWTNIWQELDPLAFVMHRVVDVCVGDGAPAHVDDRRLTQEHIPTDLSFHSSYWRDRRFASWLATHLEH